MIHFGTGGWREIIGDGFTRANVRLLVQGLCDAMAAEGVVGRGVVVGYDRRFLSDVAAWWATEVFLGNEVPVTLVTRPAPTPMFMWTVRNKNCAYGIAVTASHNPALYNGIKVFTEGGRDADAEVTDALEKRINALGEADVRALEPEAARASSLLTRQSSLNWYIDAILEQLDVETIRHRHLTIVLDPMFGVAQTCLQTILMTARCQVDVINDRHDALFGGRLPSPNAATLEPLRQAVLERGADLGIATDGDADRLGIIDDAGTFLHPNQILVLLYEHLLSGKGWTGPAVRNMSTTHLLDRVAAAHGERCYEVPVGFKWISAKMAETDAVIGGESSGGLTVRGHIAGKDGVYAGSLLVEMVAASGMRLSELYADLTDRYGAAEFVETSYPFDAARRADLDRRIFEAHDLPAFGREVERVSWTDGCKVYFGDEGWLTIRFSGTEPVLRVFAELPTKAEAQAVAATVASYYGLSGGVS
ncbi:MAG: phosphoglucomutase/phosphomannomutase family protein [Micropruina sp.]|nr:MAG: phosphoglucomutase/phosphomannomutase family protein [Micropruina sp.]